MPRDGSGVASWPPNGEAVPLETIDSAKYNAFRDDLLSMLNGVLPIAKGGTGASNAASAFANLKQAATDSATGVVELATSAEMTTGTDTARAATPAGVKAAIDARVASETEAGLIELATAAEVLTGTDTTRAVTVAGLVGRSSTTTRTGLVELATNTETVTGTDTARAVTPSGVAAAIAAAGIPTVWTGSSASTTDFPIGHQVIIYDASNVARNGTIAVCLDGSDTGRYRDNGSGTALAGTWRSRGFISVDSNRHVIAQRVA